MPPSIASSPFLSLQLVDRLLSSSTSASLSASRSGESSSITGTATATGTGISQEERVKLLAARVYLLTNEPHHAEKKGIGAQEVSGSGAGHGSTGGGRAVSERVSNDGSKMDDDRLSSSTLSPNFSVEKRRSIDGQITVLHARLDLAKGYLALSVPDLKGAMAELGAVEEGCRGLMKLLKRRLDHAAVGGESAQSKGVGASGSLQQSTGGPVPTLSTEKEVVSEATWGRDALEQVTALRIEALREMVGVDEAAGKTGLASRNRALVEKLEAEQ